MNRVLGEGAMTRRALLKVAAAVAGFGGLFAALDCGPRGQAPAVGRTAQPSAGGMMGATTADMSSYMDLFDRHKQIRRTVQEIPGGVRTTTESDDPAIAARLQEHVASMYQHVGQGQEVKCMSGSLPILFGDPAGYRRQLTVTAKGVSITETSDDPRLVQAIRAHAREVTGFVKDGMPAMMRGMMGG